MLHDFLVTRRHLLGAGTAALALAAVRVKPSLSQERFTPYRAIYDERFEAGQQFATDAIARGWTTRAIRGDVTRVWFRELAVRWKHGPAPIAGLTTPESLFVLERLAWDARMRVTVREHDTTAQLVRWTIG